MVIRRFEEKFGNSYKAIRYQPQRAFDLVDTNMYDGSISIHIQADGTWKYQFNKRGAIPKEAIYEQQLFGVIEVGQSRYILTSKQTNILLNIELFSIFYTQDVGSKNVVYTDSLGVHQELCDTKIEKRIKVVAILGDNAIIIDSTYKSKSVNANGLVVETNNSSKTLRHMDVSHMSLASL